MPTCGRTDGDGAGDAGCQPAAGSGEPEAGSRGPAAEGAQPAAEGGQPSATGNQLPAASDQLPATSEQPPASSVQQSATVDPPAAATARARGAAAERRACRHLLLRGWRIVARNWVGGGGELDIVASRWRTLLVVEVRQRGGTAAAFASVDRGKLDRTLAAAQALVQAHRLQRYRLRVDVIGFDQRGRLQRRCDVLAGGPIGS